MARESVSQLGADAEELKRDLLVSRVVGNILGFGLIGLAALAWQTGDAGWFYGYLAGSAVLAIAINALSRWVRERQHLRDRRWASRLEEQATHDELTGMFNRRYFNQAVEEQLAQVRTDSPDLALALIDVDGLKRINDTLGHAAGDTAIRMTAEAITSAAPAGAVAARLGGDEFAVLFRGGQQQLAALAESLKWAVRASPFAAPGLSVSVGVALWSPGDDGDALLRRADASLYTEKAPKNRASRPAA